MQASEIARSSLLALKTNKIRTFLTIIGVVIGVFSVVTLIGLGQGVQNYITAEFESLGSNLLFVSPGSGDITGDPAESFTDNKLAEKHIDLIRKEVPSEFVQEVTPYVMVGANAEYKTKNYYSDIAGSNEKTFEIINYEIDVGRNFTRVEEKNKSKVAILAPNVKKNLFGNAPAVGERIRINGEAFEVIGVFKSKGSNYDDQILMPYTTAMEAFDVETFANIIVKVPAGVDTEVAVRQLELALLRDLNEDDFSVMSQADLLDSISQILGVLTAGLGAIAAISLIVGGIGIMNIMLVAVTERTQEIGLRKALGATSGIVAAQFLFEAIFVSSLGGIIGLLLGALGTLIIRNWLDATIPLYAVFLSFGFSLGVGVIFGTYPAIKASRKSPIEALRFE